MTVFRKVLVNQIFMSPFLNALFFTYVIMTRNTTASTTSNTNTKKDYSGFKKHNIKMNTNTSTKLQLIKKKLSQDLLPTIYRSCVYWITLNLINFRFVKVMLTITIIITAITTIHQCCHYYYTSLLLLFPSLAITILTII